MEGHERRLGDLGMVVGVAKGIRDAVNGSPCECGVAMQILAVLAGW